jgi:hypothetical protein
VGSTPGLVNGARGLLRWLLLNGLLAGVTETILATIPALEHVITAQAGGESRIDGAEDFLSSVCSSSTPGFFTHADLRGTQVIRVGHAKAQGIGVWGVASHAGATCVPRECTP